MRVVIWRVKLTCVLATAVLFALLAAGCGATVSDGSSGNGSGGSSSTAGAPAAGIVSTASVTASGHTETALTDGQGRTLYYFDDDSSTTSACTTGCSSTWPPLIVSSGTPTSTATLSGALSAQDVGNGLQVLYNGHPLYRYSGDTASGQTNGDGTEGKWHVTTPDVAVSSGSTGAQPTPTSCTGIYCY